MQSFTQLLTTTTLLLATTATAFRLNLYSNGQCTGKVETRADAKPGDGCQSAIFSNFDGIMITWDNDNDNRYMFTSYSDDNCCHDAMVEQISWDDDVCQQVIKARSYRVVEIEKPDDGKPGEIYACGAVGREGE